MSNQNRDLSGYEPIGEQFSQEIESENEKPYTIYGYKENLTRSSFYHICCILFLGIPYVILFWYPKYKVIKLKKCSMHCASKILLCDEIHFTVLDVYSDNGDIPSLGFINLRYFIYQNTKYVWIGNGRCFAKVDELFPGNTLKDIVNYSHGLLESEEKKLLKLYGPNKIDVKIKSYWKLFVEEVFNPYYLFQAFSVTLWFFDDYYIYAACVLVLSLSSAITGLMQTRKLSKAVHDLVESSTSTQVQIRRRHLMIEESIFTIDPSELVPGDLIVIPNGGCIMPCDAVLVAGNCIVNESMLTGESVPVTKTPPYESLEMYSPNIHKRHTLYCGTHIIQPRYYNNKHVLARVVRTGFNTTKGALVKSIMYPSAVGQEFYKDAMKFVSFLFTIAGTGMCYCLYLYIQRKADIRDTIIRTLDIITIVVPPALPAAMTVATVSSQNRLKRMGIYCISPARINTCGRINLVCFDKTGTLTNEGLDLCSVIPAENAKFSSSVPDPRSLDTRNVLLQGMAACHSLTRIDGKLSGDPLDLIMFDSTHWELEEAGGDSENTRYDLIGPTVVRSKGFSENAGGDAKNSYEIGIIRQFQFSSTLQCMSVICKDLSVRHMTVFTKGAPEKIASICDPKSLPSDYFTQLSQFTASGYRVIAVGYKNLPRSVKWAETQRMSRELVECDLVFVGFIVMQNTLKLESKPVIRKLQVAKVRSVMITGDNLETAICVARECGMINLMDKVIVIRAEGQDCYPSLKYETVALDRLQSSEVTIFDTYHFAIDGRTWSVVCEHYADLIPMILVRTTVFARFQPNQKTQVVVNFQRLDYVACMVGDGANDCGALKAAHVGVSLSQTEASVAAPFTSTIDNVSCVIHLMLQGRCALVTSFAEIKYMAMYSLIQFFTILMLYRRFSILGDTQFLFIDLIVTTAIAFTLGRQEASKDLVSKRPLGSLISLQNLIPLSLQLALCAVVQYGAMYYLIVQPWFQANLPNKHEITICWENTVLFLTSSYQYVIMGVLYSKGKPYREGVITNFWLLISSLILTCITTYLLIYPTDKIADFFDILPMSHEHEKVLFRYTLLLFPIGHLFIAWLLEIFVADSRWLKSTIHFFTRSASNTKYKILLEENDVERLLNHINTQSCQCQDEH